MTHLDALLVDELLDAHFVALDKAILVAYHQGRRELVVDPGKVWPAGGAPTQDMLEAMAASYKEKHFVVSWRMAGKAAPRLVIGRPEKRREAPSIPDKADAVPDQPVPPLDSSTAPPERDEPVAEALVLPDDAAGEVIVTDVDAWSMSATGELEFRAWESDKPDDPQWKHWSCFCTWDAAAGDWIVTKALLDYVADVVPAKRRLAVATAGLQPHKPLFPELLVSQRRRPKKAAAPPMEEPRVCGWRMHAGSPGCKRVGVPLSRNGFSCAEHLCPVCTKRKRERGCTKCGSCARAIGTRRRTHEEMAASSSSEDDGPVAKRLRTE